MLDDIQDGSHLRRGLPATHTVFGHSQTINAAGYGIIQALEDVLNLGSVSLVRIVLSIIYVSDSAAHSLR